MEATGIQHIQITDCEQCPYATTIEEKIDGEHTWYCNCEISPGWAFGYCSAHTVCGLMERFNTWSAETQQKLLKKIQQQKEQAMTYGNQV